MIVGSAQVRISPDTTGFRPGVRAALESIRPIARKAGKDAGDAFSDQFERSLARSTVRMQRQMQQAGKKAGDSFSAGMQQSLERDMASTSNRAGAELERGFADSGRRSGSSFGSGFEAPLLQQMSKASRRVNRDMERDFSAGGRNAGRSAAKTLKQGFESGSRQAAKAAADNFTKLWALFATQGTAIAQVVGGLSSLVGGLYAVGTAAASAAASLVAVGGVLGSVLQGGIAVAIAFKGVGDALGAGFKAAEKGASDAGAASAAAARRVADARERLGRVYEDNARRMADAEQKVVDAAEDLADAQRDLADAQRGLNAAREEAIEDLQQLGFSVEDAALAEERAAISLEKAYEQFEALKNLPVDSMARREAELAFKEAELGYRQSKDRASDLADEQERAAKAGVEGTDAYQSALEDVRDSEEKVFDAEEKLADARADRARVAQDNARALADANKALARALEDAGKASASANQELNKYNEALNKLAPSAREFVEYLVSMKDAFADFKRSIQGAFFDEFTNTFKSVTDQLLPMFQDQLTESARLMGILGRQGFQALANDADGLEKSMELNNDILAIFNRRGTDGRNIFDDLVLVFNRFRVAIQPVTELFSKWIVHLADSAEEATNTAEEMEKFTAFFDRAGDRMSKFGEIIAEIRGWLGALALASDSATTKMLDYFLTSFQDLHTSAEDNLEDISVMFDQMADNSIAILDFFGSIAAEFAKLGASENIEKSFKILTDGTENSQGLAESLGQVFEALDKSGPALAILVTEVAELLSNLAESGALTTFFETLSKMFGFLNEIVSNEFVQKALAFAGPLIGVFKALKIASFGFKTSGNIVRGYMFQASDAIKRAFREAVAQSAVVKTNFQSARIPPPVGGAGAAAGAGAGVLPRQQQLANPAAIKNTSRMSKVTGGLSKAFRGLSGALRFLGGPLGLILLALPILIPLFKKLWDENEGLQRVVKKLFEVFAKVADVLSGVFQQAMDALVPIFFELFTVIIDAVVPVFDELLGIIMRDIIPIFQELVGIFVSEILPIFQELAGIFVSEILPIFQDFVAMVAENVIPIVVDLVRTVVSTLVPVFKALVPIIATVVKVFLKIVATVLRNVLPILLKLVGFLLKVFVGAFKVVLKIVSWVMKVFASVVAAAFKGFRWAYDNILKPAFRIFRAGFDGIVSFVRGIKDTIGNIWKGIVNVIRSPIKSAVEGINKWLIRPLNAITSKFGLNISPIRVNFAEGGFVGKRRNFAGGGAVRGPGGPTDDSIPANLSNGEYVIRSSSVKKYGVDFLDQINAGRGGIGDWFKERFEDVKGLTSQALDMLKKGAGVALGWLFDRTAKPALESYKRDHEGNFVADLFVNMMLKFGEKMREWGGKKEEEREKAARGPSVPGYNGPPGGWTYPLSSRVRAYNWPGHSPYYAVDMAAPVGLGVRAASAGRVSTVSNLGSRSYGRYVVVQHGNGVSTLYAHLAGFTTSVGSYVKTGQTIGISGNSGGSTGPHLHFELRPSGSTIAAMSARGVKLASGGVVKSTPGGVMAMLAEGGQHERVEPLDRQGLSARDRALIDRLGGGSGNTVVRVYIGDTELRDLVRYEVDDGNKVLARNLRTGRRRA